MDSTTAIGPLVSARQRQRVLSYIARGRDEGERITTGGAPPSDIDRGFFVTPTVLCDIDNSATIARKEIFGPVVTILPFDSVDDAVAIANDSQYGLGGHRVDRR